MADVNVISVNPSKQTLGALNFEFMHKMARTCRPMAQAIHTPRFKTVCNFIFGINKNVTPAWSAKLFFSRAIISAFFIAIGIIGILSGAEGIRQAVSIFNIVIGGMLFLGFFARIASFAGFLLNASIAVSAALGYTWSLSAASVATFEMAEVTQALLLLIVAISGPGRYSIDQILRRAIFRKAKYQTLKRSRSIKYKESAIRMSYRAWGYLRD